MKLKLVRIQTTLHISQIPVLCMLYMNRRSPNEGLRFLVRIMVSIVVSGDGNKAFKT